LGVTPFNTGILNTIGSYGNEAVNYFFFLSGFIMMIAYYKKINEKGEINKYQYWLNRFARIYPVYLLGLLMVGVYYLLIDNNIFTSFLIRFPIELILLQSWIGKTSLNFPGWSLSVEFFFYLCFPFILPMLVKIRSKNLILLAALIFLTGQVLYVFFVTRFGIDVRTKLAIEYFPAFSISTFVLGCITGLLYVRHNIVLERFKNWVKPIGYLGALVAFAILFCLVDFSKFHHNGLMAPVYGLFLLPFAGRSKMNDFLGNSFFIFLGDISYGIYILQFPVWLFYRYSFGIKLSFTAAQFYGYLLTLIVLSTITYKWYEKNIQKLLRGFNQK
jgi:peptidoglycan/LPS O-acetylase OafA/YrhL